MVLMQSFHLAFAFMAINDELLELYSVQRSVATAYLSLLLVFETGSRHAAAVNIYAAAVLWQSRRNNAKQ
jgi:hypothetical protein